MLTIKQLHHDIEIVCACAAKRRLKANTLKVVKKAILWFCCALAIMAQSAPSFAQGEGFKLGRFRLSPSVSLGAGYDSNPLFAESDLDSDIFLTATPGVSLSAKTNRFNFDGGYSLTRNQYLDTTIQNNTEHRGNIRLAYETYRWSFALSDRIRFTRDPADDDILERIDRSTNEAKAEVSYFAPSKDFEFVLGYTNSYSKYDGALQSLSSFSDLVVLTSTVNVSSFFRFLPKTALTLAGEFLTSDYPNADPGERSSANGFGLTAGLNGRVTPRISTLLTLGFRSFTFDVGPNTNTLVVNAAVNYVLRRLEVRLGFEHTSETASFTNYRDVIGLVFNAKWTSPSKKFNVSDETRYQVLNFSGNGLLENGLNREDKVITNSLRLGYRLVRRVELFAEHQFTRRNSNASNPITGASSADFSRHVALIGVLLYY